MTIRSAVDFDQSAEDRAARKTTPLNVFDVRIELTITLPDVHPEMRVTKAEGRQAVQGAADRANALVNGHEGLAPILGWIDIDPKFNRAMEWNPKMGEWQCKDHGVSRV